MNAFYLDYDFNKNAEYHVDRHVVKMIVEAAQCASTAKWILGEEGPYRKTHVNHPTVKWTAATLGNYTWMCNYGLALCKEYTYRYGKIHKTQEKLEFLIKNPPAKIPLALMGDFALAMPDEYKHDDPVVAYRNYYIGAKRHLAKWTKRNVPDWWS